MREIKRKRSSPNHRNKVIPVFHLLEDLDRYFVPLYEVSLHLLTLLLEWEGSESGVNASASSAV